MKMQWSIVICGATTIEVDKVKRTKRRLPTTEMYLNNLISYVKEMEVKLIKVTNCKNKKSLQTFFRGRFYIASFKLMLYVNELNQLARQVNYKINTSLGYYIFLQV